MIEDKPYVMCLLTSNKTCAIWKRCKKDTNQFRRVRSYNCSKDEFRFIILSTHIDRVNNQFKVFYSDSLEELEQIYYMEIL